MAIVHLISENEASDDVKAVYKEIKDHYCVDFVPNYYKALAYDVNKLREKFEADKTLEGKFGREKFHLIGLAVAISMGCEYCINFHTAMLKMNGYDDGMIESVCGLIAGLSGSSIFANGLLLEPDLMPQSVPLGGMKKAA